MVGGEHSLKISALQLLWFGKHSVVFNIEYIFLTNFVYKFVGYLSDFHNVPLVWEHLIPALIDLIEGTLLLCSKVGSDLGLGDATYRILPCLIT